MSRAVRDWQVACKDCGKTFTYSDRSVAERAERGLSRPERCPDCRRTHNRDIARIGAPYLDLTPGRPVPNGGLKAGRLGRLQHPDRPHIADTTPPPPHDPDRFGLKDERVLRFMRELDRHQVAIVVAPTGSGKSTFLPYRLLQPPDGLPEDFVTRHGRIIVTQPRIEASSGIPTYVAKQLHGARRGPGSDIGFRNSRKRETDQRNLLVYLTDGTLLNMIRRGELHDVSVVVLDEAHERSLNIDLIIALLRRELRALPHLKLVIASATIDAALFRDYFAPDFDVLYAEFPGKEGFPVRDRFRLADPIPAAQLTTRMPVEVARTAYEVLRWMAYGETPADLSGEPVQDGDILCFLHGKAAIAEAIEAIGELLEDDPELEREVELLPLHSELSEQATRRALERPAGKRRQRRWRVVVATNIAETSLTVEGIRHVIDSGLINESRWDPVTVTRTLAPQLHSRSGLIQRRGRAGRVAPGIWHCLLTQAQFNSLTEDTPPEIVRAPLETVVLDAAAAGVSDPASLRWLPPGPPADELRRATTMLRNAGALDAAGDPTALGREIGASREPIGHALLLGCADSTGCAVEASVVIAAMAAGGLARLLAWDSAWPAATRVRVDRIHQALLGPCRDDLDAVLTLWAAWEDLAPDARRAWAERRFLSPDALEEIEASRDRLLEPLQLKTKTAAVRAIKSALVERLRRTIAWAFPDSVYRLGASAHYAALVTPRSDEELVRRVHQGAELELDPASRTAGVQPATIIALDRRRRRRWLSPLEAPAEVVQASFCVEVEIDGLERDTPLLLAARSRAERTFWDPDVLPGDRFWGERTGGAFAVREVLAPEQLIRVHLEDDDEAADDAPDRDVPTTAQETGLETTAADLDDPDDPDVKAPVRHVRTAVQLAPDDSVPEGPAAVVVTRIDADGRAVLRLDNDAGRIAALAAEQTIASRVELRIVAAQRFTRDARVVVTAVHDGTGVEIALDRNAFGSNVRDVLLERLVGQTLPFEVDATDAENGTLDVSRTLATVAALDTLVADGTVTVDAEIIDATAEGIFALAAAPRAGAPFIVFRFLARDLPVRPDEMRIGQAVRLQLRPRTSTRRATFWVGELDRRVLSGTPIALEDDRIVADEPILAKDVVTILQACGRLEPVTAARVRAAVRALAMRTHQPRTKVIDVTGIRAIATAPRPVGRIVQPSDGGWVRVEVEGLEIGVPTAQTSWDKSTAPTLEAGDEVPVFVSRANPAQGMLRVSLRDPAQNPYLRLELGTWITARIERVESGHAILSAGGARVLLPGSETGIDRGSELSSQLREGDAIEVRIIECDPTAERATATRYAQEITLPLTNGRERLLQTREPKHAGAAFRVFATDGVRVELDGAAVTVRSTSVGAQCSTADVLRAALTGPLVQFQLPHRAPLFANDRAVLERLRREHRVIANVVGAGTTSSLVVAAPDGLAVDRVRAALEPLYLVQAVQVGRYRKEVLAELRQQGLRIGFRGPFVGGYQSAWFKCEPVESPPMTGLLMSAGIAVYDAGLITDPRLTVEALEGPTVMPPPAPAPAAPPWRDVSRRTDQVPSPTAPPGEVVLEVSDREWARLNRPKYGLRIFGRGSVLDDLVDTLDIRVHRPPGGVRLTGEPRDVQLAVAQIGIELRW